MSPFGSVVIIVFPGTTKLGNEGGSITPKSGKSRDGKELDRSPVSHPNKPPKLEEDCCVATKLANLALVGILLLLHEWAYPKSKTIRQSSSKSKTGIKIIF